MNLKGRKSAKSEQQEAPAPQLVMAGGQTPWNNPGAGDAPGGTFGGPGAPQGMPAMPPPPPGFAPGQAPVAEAPSGRKAPSRNLILAVVAVLAVGGGGYYFLNQGSSDPAPAPIVHHLPVPGSPAARAAALRAAAAAKAAATKTGTTPAKGAAIKPTVAKAPAKTPAKVPAKTTAPAVAAAPAFSFSAALPGQIGVWPRVTPSTDNATLLKQIVSGSPAGAQAAFFGGSATEPYLLVVTGQSKSVGKNTALLAARLMSKTLDANGFAVAAPIAVSHAPWGGTAACGTAAKDDELDAYCTWNDHNTYGVIIAPHRTQANAPGILNMVRGSVEH